MSPCQIPSFWLRMPLSLLLCRPDKERESGKMQTYREAGVVRSIFHAQASHCSEVFFPTLIRASLSLAPSLALVSPPYLFTRTPSLAQLYMNTNTHTHGQQVHIGDDIER